ncbi:hypothetical protein KKC63_03345 [Patescibacteria group bacterium]|nr:hypothetical protein [Patescibacteria group bacterium]MBU4022845.1 hypothetical protein [Patescibacteria group bacterium]MBU4078061.1 hypothetical protein [Patescibacteria group bacterium]
MCSLDVAGIRRSLLKVKHHSFSFPSILRILYNVRNEAVHSGDFYSFAMQDEQEKSEDYEVMTMAWLGKKKNRRREYPEIKLTYPELRDIFIRTAIRNIQTILE